MEGEPINLKAVHCHEDLDEQLEYDVDLNNELENAEYCYCNVILRLFLTPIKSDEWKHTTIFHKSFRCKDKRCKLVVDNGRAANMVSKIATRKLELNMDPHPHPFTVVWVDKTILPITQRGKMRFMAIFSV